MSDQPGDSESFASLFDMASVPKARSTRVGEKVSAVVVQVGQTSVFVELDGKRQAFLEAAELRDADGNVTVKVGDTISAHVLTVDSGTGEIRLGRTMASAGGKGIAVLEQARAAHLAIDGKVTGVNKGGLDVDVAGTRAFCPMSQIDRRFSGDAKEFIGQTLRFLVTDVRDGGKNVVVSRRALMEREAGEVAEQTLKNLAQGAVVRGTVTAVRDFGAFVDLGGVEGLIPASEISHDRSRSVGDAINPGDVVDVLVREIKDGEKGKKITLSLKALAQDPWEGLAIEVGQVVGGAIVRVVEFGAFVRLDAGVEGLLHVSELGGKRDTATRALNVGQRIKVVVQSIDKAAKKLSLGAAPEDAAEGARVKEVSIAIGSVVKGKVDRIETYGVFVQIDGTRGRVGRGLVPVAELGVPRGTDLRKTFPEGTELTVKVLETGEGKLRLSVKAAKDAEERAQFEDAKSKVAVPKTLGTFGDLLKKKL